MINITYNSFFLREKKNFPPFIFRVIHNFLFYGQNPTNFPLYILRMSNYPHFATLIVKPNEIF